MSAIPYLAPIDLGSGGVIDAPVALAPMAGITDRPMRDLALRFGAGWVVSEMVASQEFAQGKRGVRAKAALSTGLMAVQIAGREPAWVAEAARRIEAEGAPFIDLNMGCPAKKVTTGWSGAALLREPDRALRLIEAAVGAVSVPVTLKTRLGWEEGDGLGLGLARRAEASGIRMLTLHGRTRCQFYKGTADWTAVGAVASELRIPVIVNGDIRDAATARAALAASGARGVMVGRAAQGQPWIVGQIAAALSGRSVPATPSLAQRAILLAKQYEAMLTLYGTDLGLRVARKHLGWTLDAAGADPDLRARALTATYPDDVLALLAGPWRRAAA